MTRGSSKRRFCQVLSCVGLLFCVYVLYFEKDGTKKHQCSPPFTHASIRTAALSSKQWIIISQSFYTNLQPEITYLAAIPGWRLLVVGDGSKPGEMPPNSVYLQPKGQDLLSRSTNPWEWGGCLYALKNGAETIYVPGKDIRPGKLTDTFHFRRSIWSLIYIGKSLFNPFRHFGQPNHWPLGFPFMATDGNLTRSYRINHLSSPVLQHGVYNGADAVCKENGHERYKSNVAFDQHSPSVVVAHGVFTPFMSEDTLFRYDALWALVLHSEDLITLPNTYRAFWIQRLLWEMGGNVGFFPSSSSRVKRSSIHKKEAAVNITYSDHFIKTLSNWRCQSTYTFFECIEESSTHMVRHGFLTHADVNITKNVLQDLSSVGYKEPTRIPFGTISTGAFVYEDTVLLNQTRFARQMTRATYSSPLTPVSNNLDEFNTACANTTMDVSKFVQMPSVKRYPNILLIIVFNFPHYENIPYLETIYRYRFPHILYCGSRMGQYVEQTKEMSPMSFIEVSHRNGWFGQNCLIQAMKMNYKVDGYLYLADDALLNVWNLHSQPWDKLWLQFRGTLFKASTFHWFWFRKPGVGIIQYEKALKAAKFLDIPKFERFHQHLVENTGKPDGFFYGGADIAYVPKSHKENVLYFLDHFSKFNFFLEMVFPTVFGGLEKMRNIYEPPGKYLWNTVEKIHIELHFNKSKLFLHPVKISKELKSTKGAKFFCETYLPLTLT